MKTKQEQIEEMAKERNEIKDIMNLLDKCVSLNPMCKAEVATVVYCNNYRKASDVIDEFVERLLDRFAKTETIANCLHGRTNTEIDSIIKIVATEMRKEFEK